jgi:hypothetical protein
MLLWPAGVVAQVRDSARVIYVGSGVISGSVHSEDKDLTPLRRAMVKLSRTGVEDIRTAATDEQGRYTFTELPAGTYALSARKGGFVSMNWGAAKPGMPGRSIQLRDGQGYVLAPVGLARGAVIAGRLMDRSGRPVGNVTVEATQFITINSERRRRIGSGSSGSAITDDHGDYRIYGLLPGEYLVFANYQATSAEPEVTPAELSWGQQPAGTPAPPKGRPYASAPTLFPGVGSEAAAAPVTVAAGEERAGIDFVLQYVPIAKVTGTVFGPDGTPARGVSIERPSKYPSGILSFFGDSTSSAENGTFTLAGIPPGEFVLFARGGSRGPQSLFGQTEVNVAGADVPDVTIRLQPAASLAGQLVARGSEPAPDFKGIGVRLLAVTSSAPAPRGVVAVDAGGRFQIDGIPPGRYRLNVLPDRQIGETWTVHSAMLGDRDVIDVPVEVRPGDSISGLTVTFARTRSELAGVITDSSGRPVSQLYVLVFSTDRSQWDFASRRTGSVRAGDDGSYSIQGLPAGEYFLCAVTELDPTRMSLDPSYFEELAPAAIKLSISEGEKKRQDLKVK